MPSALTSPVAGSTAPEVFEGDCVFCADSMAGMIAVDVNDPLNIDIQSVQGLPVAGQGVSVSGNIVVVTGTRKFHISPGVTKQWVSGLYVYDATNPTWPKLVGMYETDVYGFQRAVTDGQYVYVVAGTAGLLIFDIANLSAPVGILAPGGFAEGVAINETATRAYFTAAASGLRVADITTKTAPVLLGTMTTTVRAKNVAYFNNTCYVTCSATGTNVLEIVNVINPVAMTKHTLTLSVSPSNVALQTPSRLVVTSAESAVIYDATNPAAVTQLGTVPAIGGLNKSIQSGALNGNTLYTSNADGGVAVWDIRTPASPVLQDSLLSYANTNGVAFSHL